MCKITPENFYKIIYSILGDETPLKTNCGRLCGRKCCSESDAGEGMYLYPFEEKMFREGATFAKISESDFMYGDEYAGFITCDGYCEREKRPLACRIFPLVPYVDKDGALTVIYDPRAVGFCPLENAHITSAFKKKVWLLSSLLFKASDTREFLISQSRLIDEFIGNNIL